MNNKQLTFKQLIYGGRDKEFFRIHEADLAKQNSVIIGLFISVVTFGYLLYTVYSIASGLPTALIAAYVGGLVVFAIILVTFFLWGRKKFSRVRLYEYVVFGLIFAVLGYYNAIDTEGYSIFIPVIIVIMFVISVEPFHHTCIFAGILTLAYIIAVSFLKTGLPLAYDIVDCCICYVLGAVIGQGLLFERLQSIAYSDSQGVLIEKEQETNEKLAKDKVLLDYFADQYSSASFIDIANNKLEILRANEQLLDAYIMDGTHEDMDRFIDEHFAEDDRELMHMVTNVDYVRARLKEEPYFTFTAKEIIGGVERTMRGVIMRGVDENHVAVGFMDITDQVEKEKEQQRLLADALSKVQEASQAKTRFLFNMSHDIRTPMNAIIGFTYMAKRNINNPEKALDSLNKVSVSSDMLLSLINDVLDMSRIESGKAKLHEEKVDMMHVYDNIDSVMTPVAEAKDIKLSFDIGEINDRYLYADGVRFNRILVNLISNAIKYTEENGSVWVSVNQIEGAEEGYARFRFKVADNGIGMSEEFQRYMFDEFSREESSTISGIQGTGLGLSLAKSLVEMMNGTISCESKQGVGSTFLIEIPFRLQSEEDIKEHALRVEEYDAVHFDGNRVLLVEDNELNRELAQEILADGGLNVETAEDGAVAVEILKEKGADYYEFILMDIQMPKMNGYEATKAIRDMYPEKHIPIIALSANAFSEDKKDSLAAGMDDHVAKPIQIKELFAALAKFM